MRTDAEFEHALEVRMIAFEERVRAAYEAKIRELESRVPDVLHLLQLIDKLEMCLKIAESGWDHAHEKTAAPK